MLVVFQRNREVNARNFENRVGDLWYYSMTVNNKFDESLRVGIAWQSSQGPSETSAFTQKLQGLIKTRYWCMSGICAGVRGDVKLGDVILADKSVCEGGKKDKDSKLKADVHTSRPPHTILHHVRAMQGQKEWLNYLLPAAGETDIALPTPIQDIVLELVRALQTASSTESVDEVFDSLVKLHKQRPVDTALALAIKLGYIDAEGAVLKDGTAHCRANSSLLARASARSSKGRQCSITAGTIFSSEFVREDLAKTIADIKLDVGSRKVIGVDMEVDAFYKNLTDAGVFYLAVKGVCDFGDQWKDDVYHEIAAEHAAAVLLDFVKHYVESDVEEATEDEGGDRLVEQRTNVEEPVEVDVSLDLMLKDHVAAVEQLKQKKVKAERERSAFEEQLKNDKLFQEANQQVLKRRDELQRKVVLSESPSSKQIIEAVNSVGQHLRGRYPNSLHFRLSSGEAVVKVDGKRPNGPPTKAFLRTAVGRKLADSYIEDCNDQRKIRWSVDGITAAATREEGEDDAEVRENEDVESGSSGGVDGGSDTEDVWKKGGGSVIELYRYSAPQQLLEVQIRGKQYAHPGVSPTVYQQLISADSMGRFYNSEIKPSYSS